MTAFAHLPGGDLMAAALRDARAGVLTPAACLLSIARTRLQAAGIDLTHCAPVPDPELRLYTLLQSEPGDAYSRYRSLLRQLSSFLRAAGPGC